MVHAMTQNIESRKNTVQVLPVSAVTGCCVGPQSLLPCWSVVTIVAALQVFDPKYEKKGF